MENSALEAPHHYLLKGKEGQSHCWQSKIRSSGSPDPGTQSTSLRFETSLDSQLSFEKLKYSCQGLQSQPFRTRNTLFHRPLILQMSSLWHELGHSLRVLSLVGTWTQWKEYKAPSTVSKEPRYPPIIIIVSSTTLPQYSFHQPK